MQPSPRPKANLRDQTMAMQDESQRVEGTQNSPNVGRDKAQNTLRWHLNGLHVEAYAMVQTWSIRHQPFKASKEYQMQAYKYTICTKMT
ncbi:hypothetical protein CsSME_00011992 [Camellia sinensis var. sinensis]